MKRNLILFLTIFVIGFSISINAQEKPKLKKEIIVSKPQSTPSSIGDQLQRPVNIKNKPVEEDKSRGIYYGQDSTDIFIDNWTGYYIDIYVNREFRGTVAPWEKKVTWAIPGTNSLFAKAEFGGGNYLTWGPLATKTGYEYTWRINPE